jgi:hypothetical protein
MKRLRPSMLNVLELPLGAVTRVVVQSGRFDSLVQRKEPTAGPVLKTRARTLNRRRKLRFTESVEFPRWVVAAGVLLIGFVLLLGALADDSGELRMPGAGSVLYMAAVIGVGAVLLHTSAADTHLRTGESRWHLRDLASVLMSLLKARPSAGKKSQGSESLPRPRSRPCNPFIRGEAWPKQTSLPRYSRHAASP